MSSLSKMKMHTNNFYVNAEILIKNELEQDASAYPACL